MPFKDPEKASAYRKAYSKAYYRKNLERERAQSRANYAARVQTPEGRAHRRDLGRAAQRRFRKLPAPTREEPACCEICGRPPGKHRLVLDHNHGNGNFRGWLCHNCNVSLGLFADNPVWLMRASEYIKRDGEDEWLAS